MNQHAKKRSPRWIRWVKNTNALVMYIGMVLVISNAAGLIQFAQDWLLEKIVPVEAIVEETGSVDGDRMVYLRFDCKGEEYEDYAMKDRSGKLREGDTVRLLIRPGANVTHVRNSVWVLPLLGVAIFAGTIQFGRRMDRLESRITGEAEEPV